MPIRVLIADDHQVVRQGLNLLLKLDPDLTVVGEARNGAEAVSLARALRPEVVVMDLLMPVMSGLDAINGIRSNVLGTEILVLTSVKDDHAVVEAIRAGATGYVMKDVNA